MAKVLSFSLSLSNKLAIAAHTPTPLVVLISSLSLTTESGGRYWIPAAKTATFFFFFSLYACGALIRTVALAWVELRSWSSSSSRQRHYQQLPCVDDDEDELKCIIMTFASASASRMIIMMMMRITGRLLLLLHFPLPVVWVCPFIDI